MEEFEGLLQVNGKGWNEKLFVSKVPNICRCQSCKHICKDAVELGCDHDDAEIDAFCKQCLSDVLESNNNTCPINSLHVNPPVVSARTLRRQILNLKVHCPNGDANKQNDVNFAVFDTLEEKEGGNMRYERNSDRKGCSWSGTLKELISNHIQNCIVVSSDVIIDKTEIIKNSNLLKQQQNQIDLLTKQLNELTKEVMCLKDKSKLIESQTQNDESKTDNTILEQNKIIEHLRYRNQKLQMQIHLKETLNFSFLIIFESSTSFKNSFISSINFNYNTSSPNMNLIKPYNKGSINNKNIIFKRVKDCSYAFASSVYIDKIIGITTKSRQQHIQSCVSTLNNCVCKFNIIYRIGGDTRNVLENNNICNILGTDVVFQLPQLLMPRFNHKIICSKIHGILCVGGEPIKKEHVQNELKEIEKEDYNNIKQKAILNSVEQLNLTPLATLTSVSNEEEKLGEPPEPELKWRNLNSSMKHRRDCPSVGLYKEGNKYEEQLFVAGGWNMRDLSCVEMYNFENRKWNQLASLNIKRNSAGICEWKQKNNNMIIIGGWNKKTTNSVEEYDAHKNQWYVLANTNYSHKYYPACKVYHNLNPFINSGNGVIVVIGNDGRLYGDEYLKRQNNQSTKPNIKNDWGFIEFYDPRDRMKKWTVIDNLPSFLNFTHEQCKSLYFQSILSCH
eukprot:38978_1